MRVLTNVAVALVIGTLGGTGPAAAGDRGSLAGEVFLVEATIVSSPLFPEFEGATFPSCLFFEENGSWIDLEWPGEGLEPIPGVWTQHSEVPFIRYTGLARWPAVGWDLVQYGLASRGVGEGKAQLTTYGMVFSNTNELIFYITGRGHGVNTCPL